MENCSLIIDNGREGELTSKMISDEDSVLTDSGVQLEDSSEMNISMLSSGNELDSVGEPTILPDLLLNTSMEVSSDGKGIDLNANSESAANELVSSTFSTFDANDNIVYRRKTKKNSKTVVNVPKKRVSFHEDILKSTRTDNIHIDHGYITYKRGASSASNNRPTTWCTGRNQNDFEKLDNNFEIVVQRNACSDVLDYGQTRLSREEEEQAHANQSGIFEYVEVKSGVRPEEPENLKLYACDCSESNSSLESVTWDSNNATDHRFVKVDHNYAQTKSNSCDCIGENERNNSAPLDESNCFFSEPNVGVVPHKVTKSVWSKERKPKSSCLKKSKPGTHIIHEPSAERLISLKKFNVHHLPPEVGDYSKTIFGSLKNIFNISMPERGVPEGSEDAQSVSEILIDDDMKLSGGSPFKNRPFLSKSLDRGFTEGDSSPGKKYVHNVDEQLRRKTSVNEASSLPIRSEKPAETSQTEVVHKSESQPYRNKYIINCESTVFEHTGVTCAFESDPMSLSLHEPQIVEAEQNSLPFFGSSVKKFAKMFKIFQEPAATQPELSPNPSLGTKKQPKDEYTEAFDFLETPGCSSASPKSGATDKSSTSGSKATTKTSTTSADHSPVKVRHLESPLHKKSLGMRYPDRSRMSPDIFNNYLQATGDMADDYRVKTNTLSCSDFDEIMTVTTNDSTDKNNMVIIDYPDISIPDYPSQSEYLKPASSKSSLINRFLRHVTQRNIIDARVKQIKLKVEQDQVVRPMCIYPGVRPNEDLVAETNAEIAMEMEQSCALNEVSGRKHESALGIGEVAVELFAKVRLPFVGPNEVIKKVFKLFAGYTVAGEMIPVLVILTQKTMYVTDLVRSRLCTKFVLPYAELDVILMDANGSSILLSNSARDMQQVLLVGGSSTASALVANLEIFARKQGLVLPAIGVLSLEHYHPLRKFLCANTKIISKEEEWKYYGIVSTLPSGLGDEREPLGPHVKGPLMYRSLSNIGKHNANNQWSAGYFLLKAGVLYMFSESVADQQKLPSSVIPLINCQGARRTTTSERPHCFELLFKQYTLQFAGSDEYAASEWLQGLVQSASGLIDWQEKHFHYGCTLVMTTDHLITLRENFEEPLCRVNKKKGHLSDVKVVKKQRPVVEIDSGDSSSDFSSSILSSSNSKNSSNLSTNSQKLPDVNENSHSNMSTSYGKHSGAKIMTCVPFTELISVKMPVDNTNVRWCSLEFTCREITECPDDLVLFFVTHSEQSRFLSTLRQLWQDKITDNTEFPVVLVPETDSFGSLCTKQFHEINRSWEPLISASLGYPQ